MLWRGEAPFAPHRLANLLIPALLGPTIAAVISFTIILFSETLGQPSVLCQDAFDLALEVIYLLWDPSHLGFR